MSAARWPGKRGGRWRRAAPARGAKGFTVVELVVVMLVAAVLMAVFIPFIGAISRGAQTTQAIQKATAEGRIALQSIQTQIGSASKVCLLDTSGTAPTASTACPSSTTPDGVQVLTGAYGSEHWVQWWYEAGTSGAPGRLLEQTWPYGQSPPSPTVTVVAGASSTNGLEDCAVAPGVDPSSGQPAMFVLSSGPPGASGTGGPSGTTGPSGAASMTLVTVRLQVTCGQSSSSTVEMSSTTAALDTALGG